MAEHFGLPPSLYAIGKFSRVEERIETTDTGILDSCMTKVSGSVVSTSSAHSFRKKGEENE